MDILFKKEFKQLILDKKKTVTCRYWKQKPPQVGQIIHAKTDYTAKSRFAKLRVLKVWQWCGDINILTDDIAHKEGFESVSAFVETLQKINKDKQSDTDRKFWFVEFEMVV